MWSGRLKGFARTSAWKFTLLFSAISLVVTTTALVIVYFYTLEQQHRQLRDSVLVAAQAYRDLSASRALPQGELRAMIDRRSRNSTTLVLSLSAPQGRAGNLDTIPDHLPRYPHVDRFAVAVRDHGGNPELVLAQGTRLETDHGELLVGVLEGDYQSRREDFLTASAAALLAALVLTLALGLLFNWRAQNRLRTIAGRLESVKAGQLQIRLPVSERGDEYDTISVHINTMLDHIDELVQSVAAVTDNIAHDLRTPLSRIRLRLEREKEAVTEELVAELMKDLDLVLETFESMLELSRLERGVVYIGNESVDLVEIVQDVHALLLPLAEDGERQFTLELANPLAVPGEKNLLFRAIYNLAENALKYTSNGDSVVLAIKERTLFVDDNGPGIPAEEREKVFQRLYRMDVSRNQPGSGLGLSIVGAVARLHGARLAMESNNPGLRVSLEFTVD